MSDNSTFDRIKTQNDALWTLLTSQDEQERREAFKVAFATEPDDNTDTTTQERQ